MVKEAVLKGRLFSWGKALQIGENPLFLGANYGKMTYSVKIGLLSPF
jgi:hypothetical protein